MKKKKSLLLITIADHQYPGDGDDGQSGYHYYLLVWFGYIFFYIERVNLINKMKYFRPKLGRLVR